MRPPADPVLLLHGQPGSARDWDAVRTALGGRVRSLAIERPGWDRRTKPLDLAGNAHAALATLDRERVERATVVGHSLGGAIAAWLAAEHPHRVSALVLAAPSANCASLNRLDQLLATPFVGSVLTTSAFAGMGLALRAEPLRHRVARRFGLPDELLRGYARTLLDPLTWHSFVVEQRMLVRELPDLERRLPTITAPTTIAVGTADRIVTPASVRRLAGQIPQARLVELPSASHLLLQERPAELADLIADAAGPSRTGASAQDSPGSG